MKNYDFVFIFIFLNFQIIINPTDSCANETEYSETLNERGKL